jgi:diguanylate cyclase (GGDEF)-like protein/PAS domain S-box-containing protein
MFATLATAIKPDRQVVDTSGMNGPGSSALERVAILHRALTEHPTAAIAAMDDDGLITALPADLPVAGCVVIEKRWLVEMVVASDRVEIATAWEALRRDGTSRVSVTFRNGLHADVHWIDVRERYGVYVAVVTSDDGTVLDFATLSDTDEIPPRYGVVRRNAAGNVIDADMAISRLVGWSNEELVAAQTIDLIHPDDHERAIENWLETLSAPYAETRWRGRHKRPDGEYVWLEFTNCNRLDDPQYNAVRSEMLDISDEMAMHDALRSSEARFRRLAEALPLGLAQIDDHRHIVYANSPFADIVGSPKPSTIRTAFAATTADERRRLEEAIDAALEHGEDAEVEISIQARPDELRVIHVMARPLNEETHGTSNAIVVVADVTDRTMMRNELERRANFDALTRCYNRSTILAMLESHLGSQRTLGTGTAVIFVDLDRFKPVNDSFGHAAGDEILTVVAKRLRDAVRDHDLVGRLGGDEFLVICPNLDDPATAIEVAERIATSLKTDFTLGGRTPLSLCASVGVAWTDTSEIDADALVGRADAAMYRSKRDATGTPVVDASFPNRAA